MSVRDDRGGDPREVQALGHLRGQELINLKVDSARSDHDKGLAELRLGATNMDIEGMGLTSVLQVCLLRA